MYGRKRKKVKREHAREVRYYIEISLYIMTLFCNDMSSFTFKFASEALDGVRIVLDPEGKALGFGRMLLQGF